MNIGQTIETFNLLSQTLFEELKEITGNRGASSLLFKSKMMLQFGNDILIVAFIENFYKYRNIIHEKDYIYFNDNIHIIQSDTYIGDLGILFDMWGQLTDSNKEIMFMYLTQLVLCCDMYISILFGNKKLEFTTSSNITHQYDKSSRL